MHHFTFMCVLIWCTSTGIIPWSAWAHIHASISITAYGLPLLQQIPVYPGLHWQYIPSYVPPLEHWPVQPRDSDFPLQSLLQSLRQRLGLCAKSGLQHMFLHLYCDPPPHWPLQDSHCCHGNHSHISTPPEQPPFTLTNCCKHRIKTHKLNTVAIFSLLPNKILIKNIKAS